MSDWGNSYEYIIDGTSGLAPAGDSFALVIGPCSTGEVGKLYYIGKNSDLSVFGNGKLVDRLKGALSRAKDDATFVVVPSTPDVDGSKGSVTHEGTGTAIYNLTGNPLFDADVVIEIVSGGRLNEATAKYSLDGGESFSDVFTIPLSGEVTLADSGVKITFSEGTQPENSFVEKDRYSFKLKGAKSSLSALMNACQAGLEKVATEFVWIAQETDNVHWAAFGAKADELFNDHRPTIFVTETRLPNEDESIDDWVSYLLTQRQSFAHRWVHVVAGFGKKNFSGLLVGDLSRARVNQSIGHIDFALNVTLPDGWTDAIGKTLNDAGYIVIRKYAGEKIYRWANGRSMADDSSDYRWFEVSRTVHKAIRLIRKTALKHLHTSLDKAMLEYIKADLIQTLNQMKNAVPNEIDNFEIVIPDGQDVVNNGLTIQYTLYGLPIVRKISNYISFKYSNPTETE
ncbi:DUF2586 family protein [Thermospira aquatica]|uniref:Uncharacterized protein n=1 Tax=Thermospira aquatica TaxID=2828656 RepID=A0AAX3BEK6_9SPIR|nr:DUF2586 family protein [Thermospira aquatica]URA10538.1 hypothetical protein KDW03_01680 [Thermospira aquatica]